jgi:hypothetical protein
MKGGRPKGYAASKRGRLAQLGERLPYKEDVGGSSPSSPIFGKRVQKGRVSSEAWVKPDMLSCVVLLSQLAVTSAPADEYFGKLEMSALRIRYETMQLKKRYETHQLLPEQAEHLLLLTEDSFDRWAARYPKDPWLASTGFLFASLFAELPGDVARENAVRLYVYVKVHFPRSRYGAQSRNSLHRGVSTKADPPWAKAMRATVPSAAPSASRLAPGSPSPPSTTPLSLPSASPSPSAAPPRG